MRCSLNSQRYKTVHIHIRTLLSCFYKQWCANKFAYRNKMNIFGGVAVISEA